MKLRLVGLLPVLLTTTFFLPVLGSCQQSPTSSIAAESSPFTGSESASIANSSTATATLWSGGFTASNWRSQWQVQSRDDWGWQNANVIADPSKKFSKILRVQYPAGSASPTVARKNGVPLGGTQFYAKLGISPQTSLRLSYYVRFSENFNFVKGGKLPGLFGGEGNSGGNIPDGTDGFSTRFMWRSQGKGELYAYLPTSKEYGTSIGRGKWKFKPGVWHYLEQQVDLNQPGKSDGRVQVWLDGQKVLEKGKLKFRTVDKLKIDGIFFSTFFGGNDKSWSTPKDVYVDFANFSVKK